MVPLQYFNPAGRMHAANWDSVNRVLKDAVPGVQSASSTGTISVDKQPGNGATVAQTYLYGPTTANIVFSAVWLPTTFTLCTMTRYNGPTQKRVMDCQNDNFFHGHYFTKVGPIYLGGTFVSADASITTDPYIWLVLCSKSNGRAPNNVVANGRAIGASDKVYSLPANAQLSVNMGQPDEKSDWAFAHALAWNRALSDSELANVSNVMWEALNDESIDIAKQGRCDCAVPTACEMCPAGKYKSSEGSALCVPCANGSFSAAGASICTACSAGKYAAKADGGTEAGSCTSVS